MDGTAEEPMFESQQESYDGGGGDASITSEADVTCPYCGEVVTIALDAGGGPQQEYVQDCEVCCRPWQVQVSYGRGSVQVWVTES